MTKIIPSGFRPQWLRDEGCSYGPDSRSSGPPRGPNGANCNHWLRRWTIAEISDSLSFSFHGKVGVVSWDNDIVNLSPGIVLIRAFERYYHSWKKLHFLESLKKHGYIFVELSKWHICNLFKLYIIVNNYLNQNFQRIWKKKLFFFVNKIALGIPSFTKLKNTIAAEN